MPHGAIRVGDVEIAALCDGVVESSRTIEETFPSVPARAWEGIKTRHPETVSPSGRWRLHVHVFVLRASGRTVVFDTGFGPEGSPAFGWTGTAGSLPAELEAADVSPRDVEDVVISHVHDDHVGWNVRGAGGPTFPNARYLVHRDDLATVRDSADDEDRAIWQDTLKPIGDALVPCDDGLDLGDGLSLVHVPGHTPGHQVLVVESLDERAVLSADITLHPLQLEDPRWASTSDEDRETAARARARFIERAEREGLLYIPSHFERAFGRLELVDGRRRHAASG